MSEGIHNPSSEADFPKIMWVEISGMKSFQTFQAFKKAFCFVLCKKKIVLSKGDIQGNFHEDRLPLPKFTAQSPSQMTTGELVFPLPYTALGPL